MCVYVVETPTYYFAAAEDQADIELAGVDTEALGHGRSHGVATDDRIWWKNMVQCDGDAYSALLSLISEETVEAITAGTEGLDVLLDEGE